MSLALEIETGFVQESERVKSVDLHPTKPWILVSLYSGTLCIWNYQSKVMEKSFKDTESPVRSAKFIPRKSWIIAGSDDGFIRVYDYNTSQKIKEFQAHGDYIRCVAVHPTLPHVLSSSDDGMTVLWNWEDDWKCQQVFARQAHYVMAVAFDPKEPNSFATASLDGTVKIWSSDLPMPKFTLDTESKGINSVSYSIDGDKLYLVAGCDDYTAKVWDCETKSCIQTLQAHKHNVSAVYVHPEFPLIFTGAEDMTICIWHARNYRLEKQLDLGLGRVWAIRSMKGSNQIAFGCDKGAIMLKIIPPSMS